MSTTTMNDYATKQDLIDLRSDLKQEMTGYVTKVEFFKGIKDLETHFDSKFQIIEYSLSEKLSNRINETYWKLIPLVLGMMTVINGVFFVAYKMS